MTLENFGPKILVRLSFCFSLSRLSSSSQMYKPLLCARQIVYHSSTFRLAQEQIISLNESMLFSKFDIRYIRPRVLNATLNIPTEVNIKTYIVFILFRDGI
jgi:hypothetical protein